MILLKIKAVTKIPLKNDLKRDTLNEIDYYLERKKYFNTNVNSVFLKRFFLSKPSSSNLFMN